MLNRHDIDALTRHAAYKLMSKHVEERHVFTSKSLSEVSRNVLYSRVREERPGLLMSDCERAAEYMARNFVATAVRNKSIWNDGVAYPKKWRKGQPPRH